MSADERHGEVDAVAIAVRVVRSGGFAGLRREWTAEPGPEQAPTWIALIDQCPWDATERKTGGADRFVWAIEVHRDAVAERAARLGDADLDGPWRALVDAVREFPAPPQRSRPAGR